MANEFKIKNGLQIGESQIVVGINTSVSASTNTLVTAAGIKNYVDTQLGGTPNVANGLRILSDGSIGLGGILNQNTTIDTSSHNLIIGTQNDPGTLSFYTTYTTSSYQTLGDSGDGEISNYVTVSGTQATIGGSIPSTGNSSAIVAYSNGLISMSSTDVTTPATYINIELNSSTALTYTADYSSYFVTRSVPDVGFVTTYVDGSINKIYTKISSTDSSIVNLRQKDTYIDTSLNAIYTRINTIDSSVTFYNDKHYGEIYVTSVSGVDVSLPFSHASWYPPGIAFSGNGVSSSGNNTMTINKTSKYLVTFKLDISDPGTSPAGKATVYFGSSPSLVETILTPLTSGIYSSVAMGVLSLSNGTVLSIHTEGNGSSAKAYNYTWVVSEL